MLSINEEISTDADRNCFYSSRLTRWYFYVDSKKYIREKTKKNVRHGISL